eukprot:TRINITY_DN5618_c0_g1_i1.p1 TRINITY_DN5618_c0_g1~~TRINITY_DN5618_c0_g1_i1.p1  ORF type:complete len:199 (+),score=16.50 TRINITY_DN5618_c0_g1_i1:81-599(+)
MSRLGFSLLCAAGAGMVAYRSTHHVREGHRAVVFHKLKGVQSTTLGPGWHFIVPLLEVPIEMDVRKQSQNIVLETTSSDNKRMTLDLSAHFRAREAELPHLYTKIGPKWSMQIVPAAVHHGVTTVCPQSTAHHTESAPDQVSRQVDTAASKFASDFHVDILSVTIEKVTVDS